MYDRPCASTRGQCELVGGTGYVELGGKNLGDATPDGPGAAPFLERRRAVSNLWAGSCKGCSGTNWSMLACKGVYGSVGLRVGSRSCANVAAVPGAKGLAVSACRAAGSRGV
ncbi:unnamed protein product [Cladocopium goreaui]|uniref:Uncharacterized protein n=1 Tax=Cladocopium goreaui TaxID=2562237 RepID=A0A9P1FRQ9_9DINO|nr:unnamed protein product [Cladocopium goreaui]